MVALSWWLSGRRRTGGPGGRVVFWIPIVIVAAVVAVLGTAAALGVFESAKGKTIVLLGPKGTGKTTWASYLATGVIPAGYTHTNVTVTTDADVKLKDIGLKVSIVDNSGSEAMLNTWHKEAAAADHIFYFVDASRLTSDRHIARILKDARVMSLWQDVDAPLTLMITHADSDAAGAEVDYDAIKTRPGTVEIRQKLGASSVVVGDQLSPEGRLEFTVEALLPLTQ